MAVPDAKTKLDPISLGLIRNHLQSYADEMANTVIRTAYSTTIRDCMDFSTALCDPEGQMVAQGITIPFHLGSIPFALGSVIRKYQDRIHAEDIFIINDPFEGGIHLPDIFLFKPVFHEEELIGFGAVISHHVDIGGRVAGGACDSTEIYQEGLRIPPLKLYERGRPSEAIFQIIEKNVRVPKLVLGDLHANLAALRTGEQGFLELVENYGKEDLKSYLDALLDYTEELVRAEIRSWPDGEYVFKDYIDDDSVDPDSIPIHVKLTVQDDSIVVDFHGSSPQVRGAINSPLPLTISATAYAIRSVMQAEIPHTSGLFRAIEVIAPEASIVNPVMPAASNMRGVTGFRMADALLGALAQVVPDRTPAAGEGGNSLFIFSGYQEDGEAYILFDLVCGTWGARPNKDANDGLTNPGSVVSNIPAELMELEYPVQLEQYALVPDTGGAGKYRGGVALVRDWRVLAEEAIVSARSDRRKHPPYGLQGGLPGSPSMTIVNPEGEAVVQPTKGTFEIRKGDLVRHQLAGGGGWGNPLERDPQKVLKDVLNEKVSLAKGRELYGVAIDPETLRVDDEETLRLRAATDSPADLE